MNSAGHYPALISRIEYQFVKCLWPRGVLLSTGHMLWQILTRSSAWLGLGVAASGALAGCGKSSSDGDGAAATTGAMGAGANGGDGGSSSGPSGTGGGSASGSSGSSSIVPRGGAGGSASGREPANSSVKSAINEE
jgi:hypothetical protein